MVKNRAKFGKSMKLGKHALNTTRFLKSTRPRAKFDNMAAMAAIFKMAAKLKEDLINLLNIWYITVVFHFFAVVFNRNIITTYFKGYNLFIYFFNRHLYVFKAYNVNVFIFSCMLSLSEYHIIGVISLF